MDLPHAPTVGDHCSYTRTVRGSRYLWGSAGVLQNVAMIKPVTLHLVNDEAGDPVTVGTQVSGGAKSAIGVLQAGELLSLSINEISGVYAECAGDSIIRCWIR